MNYIMVVATCGSMEEANVMASGAVEQRLAACVQLSPVTSWYTWKGKTCHEPEVRLVMKTRRHLYNALEAFILERHSYEVPQIIQIPIEKGYGPFLDWIEETTGGKGEWAEGV